jgi:L-asparaginase / beta-aspartyl-peptidase
VAAVPDVKNPVLLALAVLERSPHVLLVGEGARQFAREAGVPTCAAEALITPRSRARWEAARARGGAAGGHGTVGAVAVSREGHVAAATSTGGTLGKRVGRVGDSPLIGAGTYADDASGAASLTGRGEAIIRVVAAKHACDLLRQGASVLDAARSTVAALERVGGEGGVILASPRGGLAFAFNTARMARAWCVGAGAEGDDF